MVKDWFIAARSLMRCIDTCGDVYGVTACIEVKIDLLIYRYLYLGRNACDGGVYL